MGEKPGMWGLLATACAVVGLVVVAGFFVAPSTDGPQETSAAPLHPTRRAGLAAASVAPRVELVHRQHAFRPVTLHRKHRVRVTVPGPTLDFTVSSFNVLGSSHTSRGGSHARFGPGPARARSVAALVGAHQVDVVGFQEMQADQLNAFLDATGYRYAAYPGFDLGRLNTENSIAWRRDTWELVSARTVAIPYFRGHPRLMPVVRLRNPQTGLEAWFANFHNPADTPRWGNNGRWRAVATAREAALVNELRTSTQLPVVLTGDMNERASYYCALTGRTDMHAALTGTDGASTGGCDPPPIRYVDWIFGSDDVLFTGYGEDDGPLVRRTSDHPMVYGQARLQGEDTTKTVLR
jgi:endonuclease/exonuclease/phosphatase family metal-dependent hydrolase